LKVKNKTHRRRVKPFLAFELPGCPCNKLLEN
jgi:hypothetical protein